MIKFHILIIVGFLFFSCNETQEKNNTLATTHNNLQSESNVNKMFGNELVYFIDDHIEKLGSYSDSIFYIVIFNADSVLHINFTTNNNVPEIIEGNIELKGMFLLNNKKVLVYDEKLPVAEKYYSKEVLYKRSEYREISFPYTAPFNKHYIVEDDTLKEIK